MGKVPGWCILALALLPSLHLLWQARDLPTLGLYHDDAIYWNSACTLASGGGYTIASLPWQPAQTKYPPLYPLYLSLAFFIAPAQPLTAALWLNWLWLPAFVSAAYLLLLRAGLPRWAPLTAAVVLACHPASLLAASRLMSDLMYAALALWSLLLASRWPSPFLAAFAFLTRTAGLTLLAALSVHSLRLRRWYHATLLAAASLVPLLLWALWCRAHRHSGSSLAELYYSDYLAFQWQVVPPAAEAILRHVAGQLLYTFAAVSRALFATFGDGMASVVASFLFFPIPVAGLTVLARRHFLRPYLLYALLLLALLCFWYYRVDERALLPLLPLLWAALLEGLTLTASSLTNAWRRAGLDRSLALLIGLALATYPAFALYHAFSTIHRDCYAVLDTERSYNQALAPAYAWVRDHTSPSTTFLTINDPDFFLHTGRRAMRLPFIEDIYIQSPGAPLRLSPTGLAAMRQFRLDCLFLSAKHFARTAHPAVRFSTAGAPLTIRFQSSTETVACLSAP